MICPKCNQNKTSESFYQRSDRTGKIQSYCKDCNKKNAIERQQSFKQKCVDYKGGKCEKCEYSKCLGALDFHHVNPNQKEFALSKYRSTSWEKNKTVVTNELDKCILLCANCHREQHYLVSLPGFEPGMSL